MSARPVEHGATQVVDAAHAPRPSSPAPSTGPLRPQHRGVLERAPLGRREAVEAGRHQAPQRVGQVAERRRRRREASAAPARSLSPTSATSSSRKNGLPPLRSSSASRTVVGQRRRSTSASSSSPAAARVERVEVDDDGVVAAGRHGPALGERLAGGGDEHERLPAEPLERASSTRSSTSVSAQCRSDSTTTTGLAAGRRASRKVSTAPGGLLAGALRVDLAERDLVAHQVEQAVGDPLDLGRRRRLGRARRPPRRRTAALGVGQRVVGRDRAGLAQRLGDRPPHVGLAVGHAAALEHEGAVLAARPLARPPRPGGTCRRRPRRSAARGAARCRSTAASMAWPSTPSSASRPTNGVCGRRGPVARAAAASRWPTHASTGSSRPLTPTGPSDR